MAEGLAPRIAARLRRDWHRHRFQRAVQPVLLCPPLPRGSLAVTVLSMVQARDTLAYLLALRSFVRHVPAARVVVVCDASMGAAERQTLTSAVPHIELRTAQDFRHPALPVGGCWERLSAITEYATAGPVIQLDADTVSCGPLPEVRAALAQGHGFVMGERPAQSVTTLHEAQVYAARFAGLGPHIQGDAECLLAQAQVSGTRYVRGCAGFTGFHRTPDLQRQLIEFSLAMRRLTAARWDEWGTEQVASNYLVANMHGTRVLPFPDYGTPDQIGVTVVPRFLHFIGSQRFEHAHYANTARRVLAELQAESHADRRAAA